jgi:hypothetical protein
MVLICNKKLITKKSLEPLQLIAPQTFILIFSPDEKPAKSGCESG